jgi:outer membrane immunogenic protein
MKKIALAALAVSMLMTGAAGAADMAVKARPAPIPPPVFTWTGFYIGVHGGGDWFDKSWSASPSAPFALCDPLCGANVSNHTGSSWLAGAQAGFNYQTGMWVLGVEADGSWTDLKGSSTNLFNPAVLLSNSRTDALATIAGRVGIATNQALFYVKGGGAWANDRFYTSAAGVPLQLTNDTRSGWMVGVGVEYAFTNNWSVKAEYNHLGFGTRTETLAAQPTCNICVAFPYDIRQTVDLVKVGLNYRFGWAGPVVAKY